jgi:hypothetical protein
VNPAANKQSFDLGRRPPKIRRVKEGIEDLQRDVLKKELENAEEMSELITLGKFFLCWY